MFDINLTFILSFFIFILAFLVSYRLIYLSVSRESFRYEDDIKMKLHEASRYTREAQMLEEEARRIINSAREKSMENYKKKIQEASEKANRIIQGTIEYSNQRLSEAISEIEKEKKEMMKRIPEIAKNISTDILTKILGREVQ